MDKLYNTVQDQMVSFNGVLQTHSDSRFKVHSIKKMAKIKHLNNIQCCLDKGTDHIQVVQFFNQLYCLPSTNSFTSMKGIYHLR